MQSTKKEVVKDELIASLNLLNEELRDIGDLVKKETIIDGNSIHIGKSDINLECSLKEILFQVYSILIFKRLNLI